MHRYPQMRASDEDREAVAELLRIAAGDGRISLDELEERLEKAYAARTYADLEALLVDLPKPAQLAPGGVGELRLSAPFNDEKRTGRWRVPPRIYLSTGLGAIKLDFTEAAVPSEVYVDAQAGAGAIVLVVPEGFGADISGVRSVMGKARSKLTAPHTTGSPRLVVTGSAFLGDVVVRHPRLTRFLPK